MQQFTVIIKINLKVFKNNAQCNEISEMTRRHNLLWKTTDFAAVVAAADNGCSERLIAIWNT